MIAFMTRTACLWTRRSSSQVHSLGIANCFATETESTAGHDSWNQTATPFTLTNRGAVQMDSHQACNAMPNSLTPQLV